jgi:N-acetylglucosaminylphosphatidylinositol deacetylase
LRIVLENMLLMEVFWGMGLLFLVLWLGGGLMAALRRDVLGIQARRMRDSRESSKELLMKAGEGSVGLVIAHPDDEAMFFTPTIMNLLAAMKESSSRARLRLLCLSSGNHDGLGEVRKRELKESCAVLGLLEGASSSSSADEVVSIIDDPELPDHPGLLWSYNKVAQHMESWIEANNITLLLTFDETGVSNHPNHRSVYEATRLLLRRRQHQHRAALASPPILTPSTSTSTPALASTAAPRVPSPLQAYGLISLPLYRKYLGLLDAWLIASLRRVGSLSFWAPAIDSSKLAMEAHRSQLVWFRHLFVLFSSYSFVNHLRPISIGSLTLTKSTR